MSESDGREAFHAAIWKAPDDDLPRLVFADWLDDRSEHDAAAFLRLLCAVRTCPPDVDRLRPLVADFRRAMVKVPLTWVEDVCPVPPAVVVGAWVDVDHEANQAVLEFIRQRRRARTGLQPAGDLIPLRPDQEVRWPSQWVVDHLWGELQPALSPAAACAIDNVPALVDVWSGVVMALAVGEDGYAVRFRVTAFQDLASLFESPTTVPSHARAPDLNLLGNEWAIRREWDMRNDSTREEGWLRITAAEFDPANRPV